MRTIVFALALTLTGPAVAQEQQAGNEASTNADATFQSLIEQCDNVDALTLRARIRVLIGRTTADAATQAQNLLDQGFAECGSGDMETSIATLNNALQVAEAGTEEVFAAAASEAEATPAASANENGGDDSAPWWQFWK